MEQVQPRPHDLVEQPHQLLLLTLERQCIVRVEYAEEVVRFEGEPLSVDVSSYPPAGLDRVNSGLTLRVGCLPTCIGDGSPRG